MILSHYAEDNTMVGPSMPSSQGPSKNITYLCNLPVKQTNFIARDIINVKCTEHCLNMGLLILYILSLWDADPILCATTYLGHLWDAKWFLKFQLLWNVLSNEYEIFNGNQPMSASVSFPLWVCYSKYNGIQLPKNEGCGDKAMLQCTHLLSG